MNRFSFAFAMLLLCCALLAAMPTMAESSPTAATKEASKTNYIQISPSATPPVKCEAANNGAIAMTSRYALCICKNGSGWVAAYDSLTACAW